MLKQLQRATLQSQGLMTSQPFGKGKEAVLAAIVHLGYVQIDTLAVVERAHHHTLWTRVPDYRNDYLEQLVAERSVFEYWFHAAAYLPMRDFRFALPRMMRHKRGESGSYTQVDPKVMGYVLDKIRLDGPQKARDFKSSIKKKAGSWWDWKPAKIALEKLFMQGDIMVIGREGMEKKYDLTERVLPGTVNTTEPDPLEYAEYLVNTHLRAYGLTSVKQITHLRKGKLLKNNVEQVLQTFLEEKTLQEVKLPGMPPVYVRHALLDQAGSQPTPEVRILSPFDNAVIHRDRVEGLFQFDFRLECYVPKDKRQFGYFCLPILFKGDFIGRVDCKAHRKMGQLEIIHLHLEKRQGDVNGLLEPIMHAIKEFAIFNGCHAIKCSRVSPGNLTSTFSELFNEKN